MNKKILFGMLTMIMMTFANISITSCSDDDNNGDESSKDRAPAGAKAVDLGLSVKWANMNIGATTPEGYGSYFAWGEVTTKGDYSWDTYKYGASDNLTKYCTYKSYGNVDSKTTLDATDDAAVVNWGGKWRMPTKAEQEELRTKCTWTWMAEGNTEYNGVAGYKVTGTNGNSIFLPAAGFYTDAKLSNADTNGYYWSVSLGDGNPQGAFGVYFGSGGIGWDNGIGRFYGQSVRAVQQ